jgi:hypothetical protein
MLQMIRTNLCWLLITTLPAVCSAQLRGQIGDDGRYSIGDGRWNFSGDLGRGTRDLRSTTRSDNLGKYHEQSASLDVNGTPLLAALRIYDEKPIALFSLTFKAAASKPLIAFPDFIAVPDGCHIFSYRNRAFAPPAFDGESGSTPRLIFDDRDHAAIISAASHFFLQRIDGGKEQTQISCGLDDHLANIPAGFTQQTLLVITDGINHAWDTWGNALTALQGKSRPACDADIGLKYLGYWTDNGAYYYYNYDPSLGYAGTLLNLAEHFRQSQIPIGYMQLDSWWYHKSFNGADGKAGKIKNPKLPPGEWNRYGGLLDYTADRALFPDGLAQFQRKLGLPLITHNRWIDPDSPYHQYFRISGVVALDPKWWETIAQYLQSSGVVGYEQDWLSSIYKFTPDLLSTPDAADQFLDGMSAACRQHGLSMQYCMPPPCFFLQGSRYENLTTIRTSDDRFKRSRWHDFLFTSRLACALGIWPWADVSMSGETYNLILSNLSAGMVGFGDAIGKENRENLLHAAREDGVIVKPDVTLTPTDSSFIAEARDIPGPLVASTWTDHGGVRTAYVFAFGDQKSTDKSVQFSPTEMGLSGPVYVYDYLTTATARVEAGRTFRGDLNSDVVGYYVLAQSGRSGIAFMGDIGKFVGTGKQRIAELHDDPAKLTARILLAPSERTVRLHGFAATAPTVAVVAGHAAPVAYDPTSGHFIVEITADAATSIRTITVTFSPP